MDFDGRPDKILNGLNITAKIQSTLYDLQRVYTWNEMEIEELQGMQQDLLHKIEFSNFDVIRAYNIYKQLKEVRIKRRILKDEQETIEPLYELIKKNKHFYDQLPKAQSKATQAVNIANSRKYVPRSTKIFTQEESDALSNDYKIELEKIKDEIFYKEY